jgi:2-C-methyl-D-erythritol 4-phosphate cytidylyltransferase
LLYNRERLKEFEMAEKAGAVIVAAGASRRMGEVDKVLVPLGGKPVLAWVIETFESCGSIGQVVVVVNEKNMVKVRQLIENQGWYKVSELCTGGNRRQDSVRKGLDRLDKCDWVIIHDGARPLVTVRLIEQGLKEAVETGSAVAAVPVMDTIKVAGQDRYVWHTPVRDTLWSVQTPQVFRFDIINEAYHRAKDEVTDDATLVELLGYKVKLYEGSYDNIKVTTPDDLILAEAYLKKQGRK